MVFGLWLDQYWVKQESQYIHNHWQLGNSLVSHSFRFEISSQSSCCSWRWMHTWWRLGRAWPSQARPWLPLGRSIHHRTLNPVGLKRSCVPPPPWSRWSLLIFLLSSYLTALSLPSTSIFFPASFCTSCTASCWSGRRSLPAISQWQLRPCSSGDPHLLQILMPRVALKSPRWSRPFKCLLIPLLTCIIEMMYEYFDERL